MNTPQSKRVSPRAIPALALLCGGLWLIAPSSGAAQGVKDLMGQAQTQSDQRAVDELIRKLKGGATASIPTTVTATRPSAPIELPAVRKSEESVAVDPKQPILPADLQQSPVVALPVPPQVEPPLQPAAIVMPPAASPSPVDVARTEALPAVDIEVYFDTRSDAVTAVGEGRS